MSSIDKLLVRLGEIDEAVDFATGPTVPAPVVDQIARGVSVQGFCAFEQFLRDRAVEWSAAVTSARIPSNHSDMKTEMWRDRVVITLPRRFINIDTNDRAALFRELADSLSSFSSGQLVAHDLFFDWPGSNVQRADIETIIQLFGITKPWSDLTGLWRRIDRRHGEKSAQTMFIAISEMRHAAAHDANASLSLVNAKTIPRQVLLLSLLIDTLVSIWIKRMRTSQPKVDSLANIIPIRKIIKDGVKWKEYKPSTGPTRSPGSTRAVKVHGTLEEALLAGAARTSEWGELVVAYDGHEIVDWRSPS